MKEGNFYCYRTMNPDVGGSNPPGRTNKIKDLANYG